MKLCVLENLKTLNMPTDINMAVAKGVNEMDVGEVIEYAGRHGFINSVNFFTICFLGDIRNWPFERYIMPDEVVDMVEKKTRGKIKKRNVFLFQKLRLSLKSWCRQRACLYSQLYILVKGNGSWQPIDKYFNLERVEPILDRYMAIFQKNTFLARVFLFFCLPFFLFKLSAFALLGEFIRIGFSYFMQTSAYLKGGKFLYVNFSTGCDPYKVDYSFISNCQDEIIHFDAKTGELVSLGCDGLRAIDFERKCFSAK